jgi:AcrR family transcriptional regulator
MFRKPGRPPQDRVARRKEIWAAVGPLIVKHGARRLTMRRAAAAAYVSVGSLYNYFPTKQSLVTFGFDHETLKSACTEFFARAESSEDGDPQAAMKAFSRFLAGQVFFIRPAMLAALESGGADDFSSRLEAVLARGDKHIEKLVTALPNRKGRDAGAVARSVRRLVLSGIVDRSVTQGELEQALFAELDGLAMRRDIAV